LSRSFVEEATNPQTPLYTACGLLWWRYPKTTKSIVDSAKLAQMRKDGVDAGFVQKVEPLENTSFNSNEDYYAALEKTLGKDWSEQLTKALGKTGYGLSRKVFGEEIIGYYAAGFRGNFLLVMPKAKLVAVRVVGNSKGYDFKTDGFEDFLQSAAELTGEKIGSPPAQ
jgi:hypothetical protein